jgi:hypothetical protein
LLHAHLNSGAKPESARLEKHFEKQIQNDLLAHAQTSEQAHV